MSPRIFEGCKIDWITNYIHGHKYFRHDLFFETTHTHPFASNINSAKTNIMLFFSNFRLFEIADFKAYYE